MISFCPGLVLFFGKYCINDDIQKKIVSVSFDVQCHAKQVVGHYEKAVKVVLCGGNCQRLARTNVS